MKSGNLNFLEPSGPLQACNGTALPCHILYKCSRGPHLLLLWTFTYVQKSWVILADYTFYIFPAHFLQLRVSYSSHCTYWEECASFHCRLPSKSAVLYTKMWFLKNGGRKCYYLMKRFRRWGSRVASAHAMWKYEEAEERLHSFLNSPRPGCFTPGK